MIASFFNLFIPTLLVTLLVLFFLFPPALFLMPFSPRVRFPVMGRIWQIFSKIVLKYICWADITIIDRRKDLDSLNKGYLFICNHQSLLDIPLYALKHPVRPLMKHEIRYIPIIGLIAIASGGISVKRNSIASRRKALHQCLKTLRRGDSLIYYPEGTRSATGIPKPQEKIHKSLLVQAYKFNIPVIPLSLYGTNNIVYSQRRLKLHCPIGILTHPEVYPQDFANADEFVNFCWNQVIAGYDELAQISTHAPLLNPQTGKF